MFELPFSFSNMIDSNFCHLVSGVKRVVDTLIRVVMICQMVSLDAVF